MTPEQHINRLRNAGVSPHAIEKARRLSHDWQRQQPRQGANRNAPPRVAEHRGGLGHMGAHFANLRPPPRHGWRPHPASRALLCGCLAAAIALAVLVLAQ